MFDNWVVSSLIGLFATLIIILCIRKLQLRAVPLSWQGFAEFVIPLIGFGIWIVFNPKDLVISFKSWLAITFTAIACVQVGTLLTFKSMSIAKNPGYAVALSKTNILITTLLSVIIFGSPLDFKDAIAILIVVFFSILLLDFSKHRREVRNKNTWFIYGIIASLLASGYAISSKFFINEQIPLLTRLFYMYLGMAIAQTFFLVYTRTKVSLFKLDYLLIILAGLATFLLDVFVQKAFEQAPNPGFVGTIIVGSVVPATLITAYFFKDELNVRKIAGMLGVLMGLIVLLI